MFFCLALFVNGSFGDLICEIGLMWSEVREKRMSTAFFDLNFSSECFFPDEYAGSSFPQSFLQNIFFSQRVTLFLFVSLTIFVRCDNAASIVIPILTSSECSDQGAIKNCESPARVHKNLARFLYKCHRRSRSVPRECIRLAILIRIPRPEIRIVSTDLLPVALAPERAAFRWACVQTSVWLHIILSGSGSPICYAMLWNREPSAHAVPYISRLSCSECIGERGSHTGSRNDAVGRGEMLLPIERIARD